MSDTIWPMLEDERETFAGFLQTLTPPEWEHPSLCAGWRVREVVAHVIAGAKSTPGSFITSMIGSGFSFDKMTAKGIQAELAGTPDEMVARLKSVAPLHTKPPKAMLGEIIVHSEDVRRGLGRPAGAHPVERVREVADYYKNAGAPIRAKKRVAGLTLQATDVDWSTGEGPVVSGPLLSLVLAISGRRVGLDDLSGAGRDQLAARM